MGVSLIEESPQAHWMPFPRHQRQVGKVAIGRLVLASLPLNLSII